MGTLPQMRRLRRLANWRSKLTQGKEQPGGFRAPTAKEYAEAKELAETLIFKRGKADTAVQWGLWSLHDALVEYATLYRSATNLDDRRDAVVGTLIAVQRFLKTQGFNEATTEPLMRPVSALVEREQNILDPLFCERKRAGAPARSLENHSKIGALAALAEAWLKLHEANEGTNDVKLRRFMRHVQGDWLCDLSLSKVRAARALVSEEAKDHPAVLWAIFYAQQIADAEQLGGPAAAITTVANSLNRRRTGP